MRATGNDLDPRSIARVIATIHVINEITQSIATRSGVPHLAKLLAEVSHRSVELGLLMPKLDADWADALLAEWRVMAERSDRRAGTSEAEMQRSRQDNVETINSMKRLAREIKDGEVEVTIG